MDDWQQGFREALTKLLVKEGRLVREGMNLYYGWADYDNTHLAEWGDHCPVTSVTDMREESWSEFVSTFDGGRETYGLAATVSCACGQIKDRQLRWDSTLGDAMMKLLKGSLPEPPGTKRKKKT